MAIRKETISAYITVYVCGTIILTRNTTNLLKKKY